MKLITLLARMFRLFGPTHTLKEALVILEDGLRTGEIVLDEPDATAEG